MAVARRYGYEQVADELEAKILAGRWQAGEQLPSLEELVEQSGFSRMTVFKALQKLESEGVISMSRGRGTFVREQPARPAIGFVTHHLLDAPYNGFSTQVAKSLEKALHGRGWNLRLYADAAEAAGEASWELVEALEKRALRGLITVNSNLPRKFLKSADWEQVAVPHVDMSVYSTAHQVNYPPNSRNLLLQQICRERGVRTLGMIVSPGEYLADELMDLGIHCLEGWRVAPLRGLPHEEGGFRLIQQLWAQAEHPDALFVSDDVVAKGVLQGLLTLGVRVPQELLVIASTNRHSGMFYPLPIAQIVIDSDEIAFQMLELLDALAANPRLSPETRQFTLSLDLSMLAV